MHTRSWLLVPGDSEKKLAKAASTGADVVVVDLADFVAPDRKAAARGLALEWLTIHRQQITGHRRMGRWVRINPLDSRMWRDDLVAIMAGAPDGLILPRACGPESVRQVAAELYELEQAHHLPNGSVRILPVAGETPASALTIATWLDASMPRLAGLTWAPQGLALGIGARRMAETRGGWTGAFAMVRAQALLAAHGAGIAAVETFHADWNDARGLKAAVMAGRADGFAGMMAIHPAQVPVINAAYAPSDEELAEARALIEAGAGEQAVFGRRGNEQPRLRHARRVLGLEDGQPLGPAPRAAILRPA
ncbi:MAG TPA: CoA ester lyase [Novosphingobium sp.]|nr:CoA ester lyase [Novosphingobium sp.]